MPLFRYFSEEKYARAFVENGETLFRSLSYYRRIEDDQVRGDPFEGAFRYRPDSGLAINRQNGSKEFWNAEFRSEVRVGSVFAYCLSLERSEKLAREFSSAYCVEIFDEKRFFELIKNACESVEGIDPDHFFHREVEYGELFDEPGANWALPEKVAMRKSRIFARQAEYRLAIGSVGAFEPGNVQCSIHFRDAMPLGGPLSYSSKMVIAGPLTDIAVVRQIEW